MDARALAVRPPIELIRHRRVGGKLPEYLTPEEFEQLMAVAERPDMRLVFYLLWHTGLRISEALGVRMANIIEGDTIHVLGKGGRYRAIYCKPQLVNELLRFAARHKREYEERIFQVSDDTVRRWLNRYGEQAGLQKRLHPHIFRHSFAINYLRQGGLPSSLQAVLGHSQLDMTMRYLRAAQTDVRRDMVRMDFGEVRT